MVSRAWRACQAKTGKEVPAHPVRVALEGPSWDEDEVDSPYPKLHARFA